MHVIASRRFGEQDVPFLMAFLNGIIGQCPPACVRQALKEFTAREAFRMGCHSGLPSLTKKKTLFLIRIKVFFGGIPHHGRAMIENAVSKTTNG
jgi:hypothetical protein